MSENNEFITRDEFSKYQRDVDSKITGVNKSIQEIEKSMIKIEYGFASLEKSMDMFKENMDEIKKSLENLKEQPTKAYDKYKYLVVSGIVSFIIVYVMNQVLK